MTGVQVFRLLSFLVLPLGAAAVALIGQRRKVAMGGWKGTAVAYGPAIGAGLSFAVFVVVIVASVAAGH